MSEPLIERLAVTTDSGIGAFVTVTTYLRADGSKFSTAQAIAQDQLDVQSKNIAFLTSRLATAAATQPARPPVPDSAPANPLT